MVFLTQPLNKQSLGIVGMVSLNILSRAAHLTGFTNNLASLDCVVQVVARLYLRLLGWLSPAQFHIGAHIPAHVTRPRSQPTLFGGILQRALALTAPSRITTLITSVWGKLRQGLADKAFGASLCGHALSLTDILRVVKET